MISFRFHLVSIVAVFLALGLGVLTGTTVLNGGIVTQLENRTDQLATEADELRRRVGQLEVEIGEWEEFGGAALDPLAAGRLVGVSAVVVTQEATDPRTLDRVREAMEVAGAEVAMELRVEGRMGLESEEDRAALDDVLGIVGSPEPTVEAAQELADRLSFGTAGTDVIDDLEGAGFLSRDGSLEGPGERAIEDPLIVVVAGASAAPLVEPSAFLIPFVERLEANGDEVVAAEMQRSAYPFVTLLRSRDAAQRMVTVDDADRLYGAVALVLAAEDLLGTGQAGHYGVKAGAAGLLPPLD
ncbi:MAG TPA: copper transporter [Actinomycetota bacterium]